MSTKMLPATYVAKVQATRPSVQVIGSYVDCSTRIEHKCKVHGIHYLDKPYKVLSKECCTDNELCLRARADKPEHYILSQLETIHNGTITLLDKFTRMDRKYNLLCRCGNRWQSNLSNTLTHKKGCPKCSSSRAGDILRKTTAQYKRELEVAFPSVKLLSTYTGARDQKKFQCKECDGTWETSTCYGCPHCSYRNSFNSRFEKKPYKLGNRIIEVQGFEGNAIDWLLENTSRKAKHITVSSEHKVPVILYRYRGRDRKHYPDIMVEKACGASLIIEVKSDWTFGLLVDCAQSNEWLKQNRCKAKAALASGYDYRFMVFNGKKERIPLPNNWHELPRNKLRALLGY